MTGGQPGGPSLLTRVLLVNCLVLLAATLALILSPATVSAPVTLGEVVVLVAGLTLLVLANLVLVRRAFAPLQQLTELMRRVEPHHPGLRIPVYAGGAEISQLSQAFNDMLDRLESERRASWQRAIDAQEGERLRVAQELHDEIGQSLTALKLLLSRASKGTPEERRAVLAEATQITEQTLGEVREIARRLRPELLDELGLRSALAVLADRTAEFGGLRVDRRLEDSLPAIDRNTEVVLYRVAQESLTNVVRHAHAGRAVVTLDRRGDRLVLSVSDDGLGLRDAPPSHGIKGMQERALMIGGRLELADGRGRGTEVTLTVPIAEAAPA
jgi:two-component system sensor histidine kinase UhpB